MQLLVKRFFDILVSFTGLVILAPVFWVVTIAIKLDDHGPVFFRQERVGRKGRPFHIYKFRTMVVGAEKKGAGVFVGKNDKRITKAGNFLRRTSLDELPQLINILKGDMSLVGPRPTLRYQVDNYDQRQKGRLKFKPGVTGWAQVNGRSALSWPQRIELDLWYIDNWNLMLDLKILLRTVGVVLEKSNLYRTADYDPISGKKGYIPGSHESSQEDKTNISNEEPAGDNES